MSRDVAVLRGLPDGAQEKADFARRQDWPERASKYDRQVAALTAAIATLEALERQGVIVATGRRSTSSRARAPSEDSKAERIQELSASIQHMHNLAHVALTRGGLEEALENIEITARDILHPHKSWCRDSEHEGACISDPSEVAP